MSETTVGSYWAELQTFDFRVVQEALQRARKASPMWVPTGPAVLEYAVVVEKSRPTQPTEECRRLLAAPVAEMVSDDNPFFALARSWEAESRRLALHPDLPSPDEIGKRRLSEINALLGGKIL
jgi:hypothetical protein